MHWKINIKNDIENGIQVFLYLQYSVMVCTGYAHWIKSLLEYTSAYCSPIVAVARVKFKFLSIFQF